MMEGPKTDFVSVRSFLSRDQFYRNQPWAREPFNLRLSVVSECCYTQQKRKERVGDVGTHSDRERRYVIRHIGERREYGTWVHIAKVMVRRKECLAARRWVLFDHHDRQQ